MSPETQRSTETQRAVLVITARRLRQRWGSATQPAAVVELVELVVQADEFLRTPASSHAQRVRLERYAAKCLYRWNDLGSLATTELCAFARDFVEYLAAVESEGA